MDPPLLFTRRAFPLLASSELLLPSASRRERKEELVVAFPLMCVCVCVRGGEVNGEVEGRGPRYGRPRRRRARRCPARAQPGGVCVPMVGHAWSARPLPIRVATAAAVLSREGRDRIPALGLGCSPQNCQAVLDCGIFCIR